MSYWAQHTPPGVGQNIPITSYHDDRDARRSGARVPQTEYPHGYLETVNPSRREDRLLMNLARRQNARSYTRGVHAGSRAHPHDYSWPEEFTPMAGLQAEARGMRFQPRLEYAPGARLTADGKPMPSAAQTLMGPPDKGDDLRQWRPAWS